MDSQRGVRLQPHMARANLSLLHLTMAASPGSQWADQSKGQRSFCGDPGTLGSGVLLWDGLSHFQCKSRPASGPYSWEGMNQYSVSKQLRSPFSWVVYGFEQI